jgi:hypothetical protein
MERTSLKLLVIALLISSVMYGQSLGDIARENRDKRTEEASTTPPKVITNKDLPKDPDAKQPTDAGSGADSAASMTADDGAAHRSAEQRIAEQQAADQWKRHILAQKNKMATLQARIDQLNSSIHSEYGSVQSQGPYNRYQARQLQRVALIQQQLDEQKRKLDQMQEAARHAGMHSAIYDP